MTVAEYFEERAAIREYCGDQTREATERGAAVALGCLGGLASGRVRRRRAAAGQGAGE